MPSTFYPSQINIDNSAEFPILCDIIALGDATLLMDSAITISILNEDGYPIVPTDYVIIPNTHEVLNYNYISNIGLPPWMRGVWSPISNLQRFFSSLQLVLNDYLDDVDRFTAGQYVNTAMGFTDQVGFIADSFEANPVIYLQDGRQVIQVNSFAELFDDFYPQWANKNRAWVSPTRLVFRFIDGFQDMVNINGLPFRIEKLSIPDDLDSWGYALDLRRHNEESDDSYSRRLNYEFGTTEFVEETINRWVTSSDLGIRFQVARFTGIPYESITVESIVDYMNRFLDSTGQVDRHILNQIKSKYTWGNFRPNQIAWMEEAEANKAIFLIQKMADQYE